jgi:hypothetical protein
MNTTRSLFCSALFLLFAVATAAPAPVANKPSPPSKPGTLQVQINIPPTWRPMLEDEVSEAFASYVIDIFRRQGYKGDIKEVRWFDEPSPGCCLLTINLTEWRMNHMGSIDCTFTANLQTEQTTRHLGVFSGMSFRWMSGPGRFGLADAFGDAAEDGIRQLYDAVARTELVPGLRRR